MVYSESGGVSKTTTAVSLAMSAALLGRKTVLIDLDPRAAATKWVGAEPEESWQHVGAILGADEDTAGWAEDLAIPSGWDDNLRVIPSDRSVSNRESDTGGLVEVQLKRSLGGLNADFVVIDCPNRQGGPLTRAAMTASDGVVYAATPTQDGWDGFVGAQKSVQSYIRSCEYRGQETNLQERGVILGGAPSGAVWPRIAIEITDDLRGTGLLLDPLVQHRVVVQETRRVGDWYGQYSRAAVVADAYSKLAEQLV